MLDSEAFYDSDEGVASGPITLKEEKARLREKNFNNPRKIRRETAFGRLEQTHPQNESKSTEYFTAETSGHTNVMESHSSLEDTNGSIEEAVGNVIRTLDNEKSAVEIIEISDEEEENEIVYISSTSSTDGDRSILFLSTPKHKINPPTLNQRQSTSLSADVAKLSDTKILQDLSVLHLSSRGSAVNTIDESFLLQSTSEKDGTDSVFTDDEGAEESDQVNGIVNYTARADLSVETKNDEFSDDEIEEGIKHNDSVDGSKKPLEDGELASGLADKNDEEVMVVNEKWDTTLDKINFILNSGNLEEQTQGCMTPQRDASGTAVKSAQNTPNLAPNAVNGKGVSPFKVPTKIPRSLRKEFVTTRSRFDNIKSPVAHYIKNSPFAPIIKNVQCRELTHKELLALLEAPPSKPKRQWPKVCLREKSYNRAKVQIVVDSNPDKIQKMPANITALTTDMGVMKRHLGRQGTSRLPIPHPIADNAELCDTFTAQSIPSGGDVSLISQKKMIIE